MFVLTAIFITPHEKLYKVLEAKTPADISLEGREFIIKDYDCFDTAFTAKNKKLADSLSITEQEAFVLGNLSKYWANNLLKGRKIYISNNDDLVYYKYGYKTKFIYSGYCIKDGKPCYQEAFDKKLKDVRKGNYKVLDMQSEKVYDLSDEKIKTLKNYLVIRKSHLPRHNKEKQTPKQVNKKIDSGFIKIFFSDSTSKTKPDRSCSSDICREILTNINHAEKTIDMAIYGYSRTPEIEKALSNAMKRGVKIRLVYDSDEKGGNIYPDTEIIKKLLPDGISDIKSAEAKRIMHNKFYIFDDKILITGSANLSHTDMSGFNSNSIAVINSAEIAKIYKREFEQMYSGKFHNEKEKFDKSRIILGNSEIEIFFSPKDKALASAVIPVINNAKSYIYLPTFVLTDKRVTDALINAKNRGVDVKILIDALNASVQHSKHNDLRTAGILVKTENYAGKMHSKSLISDDKYVIIGSMNFSNSGENKNDENLVLIKDSVLAKAYKEFFLYQWSRVDNKWLKMNARAEGKDSIGSCSDGLDNNYDGLTDTDDPACK